MFFNLRKKKTSERKSEVQNKSRNEINFILLEEELLDKCLVFVMNSNSSGTL